MGGAGVLDIWDTSLSPSDIRRIVFLSYFSVDDSCLEPLIQACVALVRIPIQVHLRHNVVSTPRLHTASSSATRYHAQCFLKALLTRIPSSVLPPPTRYPSQQAYNLAVANGQAAPMLETNNQLKFPVGPEYQLLVGEG